MLMLLKLSEPISECLAHAADARELANAATDPGRKVDYLENALAAARGKLQVCSAGKPLFGKATESELDFAATITRAAAIAMSRPHSSVQ